MNKKQRNQNRENAKRLRENAHVCCNCGMRRDGGHWVRTGPLTLEDILEGKEDAGFWICPMLYGKDGRRLIP